MGQLWEQQGPRIIWNMDLPLHPHNSFVFVALKVEVSVT